MGSWGVAVFSDDLASDIREDCRRLLGDGVSAEDAVSILSREYESTLEDADEGCVFWLSLAATLWQFGRLNDATRDRALAVIEAGSDLRRWQHDPKLWAKRRVVLDKLRTKLLSSQPNARKVKKVFVEDNAWEIGEVLSFKL